jgi:hypothetical protein
MEETCHLDILQAVVHNLSQAGLARTNFLRRDKDTKARIYPIDAKTQGVGLVLRLAILMDVRLVSNHMRDQISLVLLLRGIAKNSDRYTAISKTIL